MSAARDPGCGRCLNLLGSTRLRTLPDFAGLPRISSGLPTELRGRRSGLVSNPDRQVKSRPPPRGSVSGGWHPRDGWRASVIARVCRLGVRGALAHRSLARMRRRRNCESRFVRLGSAAQSHARVPPRPRRRSSSRARLSARDASVAACLSHPATPRGSVMKPRCVSNVPLLPRSATSGLIRARPP